jgi:hypothetical protein
MDLVEEKNLVGRHPFDGRHNGCLNRRDRWLFRSHATTGTISIVPHIVMKRINAQLRARSHPVWSLARASAAPASAEGPSLAAADFFFAEPACNKRYSTYVCKGKMRVRVRG